MTLSDSAILGVILISDSAILGVILVSHRLNRSMTIIELEHKYILSRKMSKTQGFRCVGPAAAGG